MSSYKIVNDILQSDQLKPRTSLQLANGIFWMNSLSKVLTYNFMFFASLHPWAHRRDNSLHAEIKILAVGGREIKLASAISLFYKSELNFYFIK